MLTANHRSRGVEAAKKAAGGVNRLAALLNISHAAVSTWREVPVRHVLVIEQKLRIARYVLRPDIYPPPPRDRAGRWRSEEII
jgi:DNA-binding transcriptional regulator YdaS (Cro superfamily)